MSMSRIHALCWTRVVEVSTQLPDPTGSRPPSRTIEPRILYGKMDQREVDETGIEMPLFSSSGTDINRW